MTPGTKTHACRSAFAALTLLLCASAALAYAGPFDRFLRPSTTVPPRPRVAPPAQAPGVPGLITTDPGTPLESRFQGWVPENPGSVAEFKSNADICAKSTNAGAGFPAEMSTVPFQAYWAARAAVLQIEATPAVMADLDTFEAAGIGTWRLEGSLVLVNLLQRGYQPENRMENGVNLRAFADKQIQNYNASYYSPLVYLSALSRLSKSELVPALQNYAEARKAAVHAVAALYNAAPPGPAQLDRLSQIYRNWFVMQTSCVARSALIPAFRNTHQFRDPALNMPPSYPAAAVQELLKLVDLLEQDEAVAPTGGLPYSVKSLAWLLQRANGAGSPKPFLAFDDLAAIGGALQRGEPALIQQIAKGSSEFMQRLEAQPEDEVFWRLRSMPATQAAIQRRKVGLSGLSLADAAPMSNAEKAKKNFAPSSRDLQGLVNLRAMQATGSTGIAVRWINDSSYGFSAGDTSDGEAFVDLFNERCSPERGKQRCQFSVARHISYPFLFGKKSKAFEMRELDILVYWTEKGLRSDDIDGSALGFSYTAPPPTEYKKREKTFADEKIERAYFDKMEKGKL